MFTQAIVRTPCKNLVKGLTTADLGLPNYSLALSQHQKYIEALKECGLKVTILEADENYPDSAFVEDTALLTPYCAVITNPGAHTRRGEVNEMKEVVTRFYSEVEYIIEPGTLEAGDVMMVNKHFYIGLSNRTNKHGAEQLIDILKKYGMTGSTVTLKNVLHLKSGVSYLENDILLVAGEFLTNAEFQKYNVVKIDDDESYAANSLWINDKILVPKGFPKTKKKIEKFGYKTIEVDVTEFQKLDGGLSCLSLRF
jgi:dimethylargininase